MNGSEINVKAQLNSKTRKFKLSLSGLGDFDTLKIFIRNVFNLEDNALFLIEYSYKNDFYFISSQEDLWIAIDRTLGKELSIYITEYDEVTADAPTNAQAEEPSQPVPESESVPETQPVPESQPESVQETKPVPESVQEPVESKAEATSTSKVTIPEEKINTEEAKKEEASTSKGKDAAEETTEEPSIIEQPEKVTNDESVQTTDHSEFENMTIQDIVRKSINLQTDAYRKIIENIKSQTREDADIVHNIASVIGNECRNQYPEEIKQFKDLIKNSIDRRNDAYKQVVDDLRNQTRSNVDAVQNVVNFIGNEVRNQYPQEIRQFKENIKKTTDFINSDVKETVDKITNAIDQYSTYKNIFLSDILDQLDRRDQNLNASSRPTTSTTHDTNSTPSTTTPSTTTTTTTTTTDTPTTSTTTSTTTTTTSTTSSSNDTTDATTNATNDTPSSTTTNSTPVSNPLSSLYPLLNKQDETLENVKDIFNNISLQIKTGVDSFLNYIDEKDEAITNFIMGPSYNSASNAAAGPSENAASNQETPVEVPSQANTSTTTSTEATQETTPAETTAPTSSDAKPVATETTTASADHEVPAVSVSGDRTSSSTSANPPQTLDSFRNLFNNFTNEIRTGVDSFLDYLDEKDEMITNFILGPFNEFDMISSQFNNNNNNNNNASTTNQTQEEVKTEEDTKPNETKEEEKTEEDTKLNDAKEEEKAKEELPVNEATTSDNVNTVTTAEPFEEVEDEEDKPIIPGRNNTEHSNNYFIEQFNKYKEEYSKKKLEEKKAQEAEKTPEVAEATETAEAATSNEVAAESNESVPTPENDSTTKNKETTADEKDVSPNPRRNLLNTVKNTFIDSITGFAASSRFVDDVFSAEPLERDPTHAETTETVDEPTSTKEDDDTDEKEPEIEMKLVDTEEYRKTEDSSETKDVEEFSNGVINYEDLGDVEKKHPSLLQKNKIVEEELSGPVSEDSFDYHSYSPVVIEEPVKDGSTTPQPRVTTTPATAGDAPLTPDSTTGHPKDKEYFKQKGKKIFEEEYKRGEDLEELLDVEYIQIKDDHPDAIQSEEKRGEKVKEEETSSSLYDNKVQGKAAPSKAPKVKKDQTSTAEQFETFEFDVYDDPELEKRIKQKKQETDLLEEYEII